MEKYYCVFREKQGNPKCGAINNCGRLKNSKNNIK